MKHIYVIALLTVLLPEMSLANAPSWSTCTNPRLMAESIPDSDTHLLVCSETLGTNCGNFVYVEDTNKILIAEILEAQANQHSLTIGYDQTKPNKSANGYGWYGPCKL